MKYKLVLFLKDIKLEHTLFSLPFLLSGIIISKNFRLIDIFILLIGLIIARIAGMAWNRYIDREIDAKNPRTKNRPLAMKIINPKYYKYVTIIMLIALFPIAYYYNILCVILYPLVVILILIYPYLKRYTYFSHVILGLILSFAILAPYVALQGSIDIKIIILSLAITFWVAGFDVVYSIQDYEFDRKHHLKSIPAIFGVKNAKIIAMVFHLITILFLYIFFIIEKLNVISLIPLGAILIVENVLIQFDEKYIKIAFQDMNILFSILFFLIIILNYYVI